MLLLSSTLLFTHPTSTTLFPVLSKLTVSVLSFEELTDNSIMKYSIHLFLLCTKSFPKVCHLLLKLVFIWLILACGYGIQANIVFNATRRLGVSLRPVCTFIPACNLIAYLVCRGLFQAKT
jgi:hypothetical protein